MTDYDTVNPSVKNQRFLPPSLTQGRLLGRAKALPFLLKFNITAIGFNAAFAPCHTLRNPDVTGIAKGLEPHGSQKCAFYIAGICFDIHLACLTTFQPYTAGGGEYLQILLRLRR